MNTSSAEFKARAAKRCATWTVVRCDNLDQMKTAEYAYWAGQPAHAIMSAVAELTVDAYAMKGINVSRLHRPHRAPE